MSIIFVGTPAFAVPALRRLVSDGHRITAVVTQPDRPAGRHSRPQPPPVKQAAQELGLHVLQPENLRGASAIAALQAEAPELLVVVAYGQILRRQVLDIPAKGVLNVHPSLLPRWRGASPIPAAILAGDKQTGVTIMLMDEGMDSGPILSQRTLVIRDGDTAGSLSERLANEGAGLLSETLPRWLAGEIEPQPQDASKATTCPLLKKEDGEIDWRSPAHDIWLKTRAYNPWPSAYTSVDGEQLKIWRSRPLQAKSGKEPGVVIEIDPSWTSDLPIEAADAAAFGIQTGHGVLVPLELQRGGRRALPAAEFLRGIPRLIGRRLGQPV
jgi:methionyl-tRNA formyltransferase